MKIFLYLISKLIYRNAITAAGIPSFKGAYEPVSPIPKLLQKQSIHFRILTREQNII